MQKEGGGGTAQELSAEQFTLAKEQEKRARGAEIITADAGYQVKGGSSAWQHDGSVPPAA